MSEPRRREHRIEIRAPIAAVWKALIEAEQIVRWYAPEAEVDAREGGRYFVSWGEGMGGESCIDVLEPEKRLVLRHVWEGAAALDPPMMEEYLLESRGDLTVVRLVQSGIPATAEWDDFYEDTGRGWKMFLAGLSHYVVKHLGRARETIVFMQPVTIPLDEAWNTLVGPKGLAANGTLEGVEPGSRISLTTAFGQRLEGEVLVCEPPHTLTVTIDNLEDSLLALDFERIDGKMFLYANLSIFGLARARVDELRKRWKLWIEQVFVTSEGATA